VQSVFDVHDNGQDGNLPLSMKIIVYLPLWQSASLINEALKGENNGIDTLDNNYSSVRILVDWPGCAHRWRADPYFAGIGIDSAGL
jgi:hypothetical protein